MLDFARIAYAATLGTLIAVLLWRGFWRRVPLFCCYLIAAAIQTATHWSNMDFDSRWWIKWSAVMLTFRCLAAAEVYLLRSKGIPSRAAWGIGLAAVPAGLTLMAAHLRPDKRYLMMAQAMRHAEAAILAFVLLAWMATGLTREQDRFARRHAPLFALLLLNQIVGLMWYESMSPKLADWRAIMAWTYLGAASCFIGWISLCAVAPAGRSARPAPRSPAEYR